MKLTPTSNPDVLLLEPRVFEDDRGFFFESFNRAVFRNIGLKAEFVQDNHALSKSNVLRGLHYQLQRPQGKLVRVVTGEVFDVAVDLRRNSKYFGRWIGETLSGKNKRLLWIPPGFAHGYLVLSESATFLYKTTDFYVPQDERTIRWDDADLAIAWPLGSKTPLVSEKDQQGKIFRDAQMYEDSGALVGAAN